MSHTGHPLVGDVRYGGSDVFLNGQASPLPPDMLELVRFLSGRSIPKE